MIINLIVTKEDDGYTAVVPSLKGCESWAHSEENVIEKIVELAAFYLNVDNPSEIRIDKARSQQNKSIYKLIFDKKPL